MHGYIVPSRIGTFACITLQSEFSVYSGKKSCKKKYVKDLEIINKDLKKNIAYLEWIKAQGGGLIYRVSE